MERISGKLAAATAVAAVALLAAAGCSGPVDTAGLQDATPTPTRSPSTSPTPSPTPTPTHSELTEVDRKPLWQAELTGDSGSKNSGGWARANVLRIGKAYVVSAGLTVLALDGKGRQLWRHRFAQVSKGLQQGTSAVSVASSGGVAIVTYAHPTDDRWPHPDIVEGRDPLTGKQLWRQVASPYTAVTADTVFLPVCRHTQTGAYDDCRLSARDPRTGNARWTIDAEHVAQVVAQSGRVIAMTTKPMGFRGKSWIQTLAPSSGSRLGVRLETAKFGGSFHPKADRTVQYKGIAGSTLVLGSATHKEEKNCRIELEGVDPWTSKQRWQRTIQRAVRKPDQTYCANLPLEDGTGTTYFGSTGKGLPMVLDLQRGKEIWHGPEPGTISAGDARTVVVNLDAGDRFTLYDLKSRTARWSLEQPAGDLRWTYSSGNRLVLSGRSQACPADLDSCSDVYDVATGDKVLTVAGELAGVGDGWIAGAVETHDGGGDGDGAMLTLYSTR